jgi:hypothetical protein
MQCRVRQAMTCISTSTHSRARAPVRTNSRRSFARGSIVSGSTPGPQSKTDDPGAFKCRPTTSPTLPSPCLPPQASPQRADQPTPSQNRPVASFNVWHLPASRSRSRRLPSRCRANRRPVQVAIADVLACKQNAKSPIELPQVPSRSLAEHGQRGWCWVALKRLIQPT